MTEITGFVSKSKIEDQQRKVCCTLCFPRAYTLVLNYFSLNCLVSICSYLFLYYKRLIIGREALLSGAKIRWVTQMGER